MHTEQMKPTDFPCFKYICEMRMWNYDILLQLDFACAGQLPITEQGKHPKKSITKYDQ